ncbi:hypothetical protein MnTg02_00448 [bacterium MnTg02]|nr:hypothetical protein MnTg02_00448 [bacterium MnTg02]
MTQIIVVAHTTKDKVGILGCFGRRLRDCSAEVRHPFLRLGPGPVVDDEIVTALCHNMPGHGVAHHAQSNPCDFAH